MQPEPRLHTVPDDELLRRLGELVSRSRRVEADLVAHIGEADVRGLYARQAFPSMFAYCTEALHLSEAEAYRRITVARAARKHALLLTMLRDGRLLSSLVLLAPLLTPENREALLQRATHRSKREIEKLVAELQPRPDAPSVMRKLPQPRKAPCVSLERAPGSGAALKIVPARVGTAAAAAVPSVTPLQASAASPGFAAPAACAAPAAPSRPAVVQPLPPAHYKVQFTASEELHDKLERLAALMRSEVPSGDLAAIIERAVSEKLERLEARRYAQTRAHSPGNIRLLCSRHNRSLAERDYGPAAMRRHRRFEKEAPA